MDGPSRRASQASMEQQLANSLQNIHLQDSSSPSSPNLRSPLPYSPKTSSSLSRQASMSSLDQHNKHSTPGVGSRQRTPATTPTIRKQHSLQTLNLHNNNNATSPGMSMGNGTTPRRSLSRQSSSLMLNSSRSPSSLGGNNTHHYNPSGRDRYPLSPPLSNTMAPTVIILHDSSYKHKYLRPGSKADLQSVVERPERIPAAVLGACAAQTRLGQELVTIQKSRRMGGLFDPEVRLVHGGEGGSFAWPEELAVLCREAGQKLKNGEIEVPDKFHQGDLYLCPDSREDLEGCIGAMYDGVDAVFSKPAYKNQKPTRRSFVCIRPPGHHCAETEPSGFCWINNVHIGIAHAAKVHGLTHAVILDFDLHHGDGSQSITWNLNDLHNSTRKPHNIPRIAYFSLHDINSYPCEIGDMEKVRNASVQLNAHGQCIYNTHLGSYSTTEEFWDLYEERYSVILTKAREWLISSMNTFKSQKSNAKREPKAAIFLSAGFDASEHEGASMQRHKVHVPTDFFARFTRDAVAVAEDKSTGCDGRVVSVLEGGYSNRAITSGVFAHITGLATAPSRIEGPLGLYDSAWWDLTHLAELEKFEKKKTKKVGGALHYLTATAASAAKMIDSPRSPRSREAGAASPAPPKQIFVDWATATWELSHRYIPREEELKAPSPDFKPPSPTESMVSVRSSKRHSVMGVGGEAVEIIGGSTRTLRERRPKPEPIVEESTRASRRKTVAVTETSRATPAPPAAATSKTLARQPSSRSISQSSNSTISSRTSTPALSIDTSSTSKLSSAEPGRGVTSQRPATAMARQPRATPAPVARPTTSQATAHPTALKRQPSTALQRKPSTTAPARKPSSATLVTRERPPQSTAPNSTAPSSATSTLSRQRKPATKRDPILPPTEPDMDALATSLSRAQIADPRPPVTIEEPPTPADDPAIAELEANIARKQAELEAAKALRAQRRSAGVPGQVPSGSGAGTSEPMTSNNLPLSTAILAVDPIAPNPPTPTQTPPSTFTSPRRHREGQALSAVQRAAAAFEPAAHQANGHGGPPYPVKPAPKAATIPVILSPPPPAALPSPQGELWVPESGSVRLPSHPNGGGNVSGNQTVQYEHFGPGDFGRYEERGVNGEVVFTEPMGVEGFQRQGVKGERRQ